VVIAGTIPVYTVDVFVTVVLPVVGSRFKHSQALLMSSDVCGIADLVRVGEDVVIVIVEFLIEDEKVVETTKVEELDCPGQTLTLWAPTWLFPVSGTVFVILSLR